jgi:uncharacterized protein
MPLVTPRGYPAWEDIAVQQHNKQELISDWMNRATWAVVGASQDRDKYGYKVFHALCRAGYTVYAVNPRGGDIDGHRVFPSLADLPQPVEVVNLVVPPSVTEQVVREAQELGLTRIWMQPGAESGAAIDYCHQHDMLVVFDACAMVHRRRWA